MRLLPILLLLSMIPTCIEVDMSVPGFPEIAKYFNVAEGIIQLTIAYNFLGFCIGAIIYGPLSDSYGRRKTMLIGNAIMLIGACGCIFAENINILLMSRFIQGIGASTSIVLVFAIIADVYKGDIAMKLIGIINAALGILMAGAPIIGGFINEFLGWRGNYTVVALATTVVWLLQMLFLPETRNKLEKINLPKVATDYKELFLSFRFIIVALVPSLLFAAYMSYIAASAFLYKQTFALSTLNFVTHQASIIASFAFVSMFADKIIKALGKRKTIVGGMFLSCLGALLLMIMGVLFPRSSVLMTGLMIIFAIGFAMCYPVIFTASLNVFPELRGTASSVIMSLRSLLVAGFTNVTGYLYNGEPLMVIIPIALGIFLALFLIIVRYLKYTSKDSVASEAV